MNDLLKKRCADLTVFEVLEFAEMHCIFKYPTMPLDNFCKVYGKSKRRVLLLLKNKLIPEEIILGGYNYKSERKHILFITERVVEWLKK